MEKEPMPGRKEEKGSAIEREDYSIVSDSPHEERLLDPALKLYIVHSVGNKLLCTAAVFVVFIDLLVLIT
jgi:hypothetical protein